MRAGTEDPGLTSRKYSKIGARMAGPGLFLLLAGCAGPAPGPTGSARQEIEAAVRRYVAASNQGDAEALVGLYADDAVLLPPDHGPIQGRRAIGDFWRQGTDEGLQVSSLRLEVNGDLGYLVGRYTVPPTEDEPADSGKYVMCLKRQSDGSWKLTADIWNSSSPGDDEEDDRDRRPGALIS
jgi:uncharacterized protein (TIGR02246 family)